MNACLLLCVQVNVHLLTLYKHASIRPSVRASVYVNTQKNTNAHLACCDAPCACVATVLGEGWQHPPLHLLYSCPCLHPFSLSPEHTEGLGQGLARQHCCQLTALLATPRLPRIQTQPDLSHHWLRPHCLQGIGPRWKRAHWWKTGRLAGCGKKGRGWKQ